MMRHWKSRSKSVATLVCLTLAFAVSIAWTYPIDGLGRSGIRRLETYRLAQQKGAVSNLALPPGAQLSTEDIVLGLADQNPLWSLGNVEKDAALQAALESIFKPRDSSCAVAVIDITNPDDIVWAGVREQHLQYPGSVGKVLCMAALFDGLRDAFPKQADRERILRETRITATDWALGDSHKVPHVTEPGGAIRSAPITGGERFTLSECLDQAISASANGAASLVWKEAMLLRRFGSEYPVSAEREKLFFSTTPGKELQTLSLAVIQEPLKKAGIDTAALRQGSMWTCAGKARVPGAESFGSPRELARLLLRIEQGRLVDPWSSLEMKRYLYMTRKRYRYVFAPELRDSAVYFKSGSLYKCTPEPGVHVP